LVEDGLIVPDRPVTVTVNEPVLSEANDGLRTSTPANCIVGTGLAEVEAENASLAGNPCPVTVNVEDVDPLIDTGETVTEGVRVKVLSAVIPELVEEPELSCATT
jgi:hypothetical protein